MLSTSYCVDLAAEVGVAGAALANLIEEAAPDSMFDHVEGFVLIEPDDLLKLVGLREHEAAKARAALEVAGYIDCMDAVCPDGRRAIAYRLTDRYASSWGL